MIKKYLTEFYIKNIISSFCNKELDNLKKDEAPDFSNDICSLEVVNAIEEKDEELHFLCEKYIGCYRKDIPTNMFKKAGCKDIKLTESSLGGFKITNTCGETKFIFDDQEHFIAFVHSSAYVAKIIDIIKEKVLTKTKKLNYEYKIKKYNYLGINVPNSLFSFGEENAIADYFINNYQKDTLFSNGMKLFDKIYLVFCDGVFEIDLVNTKTAFTIISKSDCISVLEKSKVEISSYIK